MADLGAVVMEQYLASVRLLRCVRLVAFLFVACISGAHGAGAPSLSGFHHTAWRVAEGAPPDIWAMSQGPQGYLWLGTGSGLYRFDGLSFDRFVAPKGESLTSTNITALKFNASGDLWIGYYEGGVSVLHDGHLRSFGSVDGLPSGMVVAFENDVQGDGVWVASRGGLAHYDGQRWQVADEKEWGYPAHRADWVLRDVKGVLWVTTGDAIVYLDTTSHRFQRFGNSRVGLNATLANAPDGRVWVMDEIQGTHPLESNGGPSSLRKQFARRLLFDREGGIWGTDAIHGGIFHVDAAASASAKLETFTSAQGLSADIAVPILQDREGNIWVGTNLGLDRFRANNFFMGSNAPSIPYGTPLLAANGRGDLWTIDGITVSHVVGAHLTPVLTLPRKARSAYCDPDGVLWIGELEGLIRVGKGRITRIPWPREDWKDAIVAYGSDSEGRLWLSVFDHGLFRYADGKWSAQVVDPGDTNAVASAIALAADGSMWFGFSQDHLVHRTDSGVRVYNTSDGLHVGNIATLSTGGNEVLVGGELGYAILRENSFQSFTSLPASSAMTQVSGIARTRNGDLWLNASRGVIRIAPTAASQSSWYASDPLNYKLYDLNDGLPGVAVQNPPAPTLAIGPAGYVWVSTNRGIAWTDPAKMHVNSVPPVVSIKAAYSGRLLSDLRYVRVSSNAPNVRIEYSALNLSAPERLRFRYRLVGLENHWTDAGSQREAGYSNLHPGHYRFEVAAANEDNVWSSHPASLAIEVVPGFIETTTFRIGAVVIAVIATLAAYLVRMRLLASAFRSRLHERLEERERIARELHDTLLQSVQGLILRFQAIANRISTSDPNRVEIESALDRADQVMAAGRERVRDLRTSEALLGDLDGAFIRIAHDLSVDHTLQFGITIHGAKRELACEAREEIYSIGREALLNAYRHANASRIDMLLEYCADAFKLTIHDNGNGFDPHRFIAFEHSSHFGLKGMHERARRVNGRLDIEAGDGMGVTIRLVIPARSVYTNSRWRWLQRLNGMLKGESS